MKKWFAAALLCLSLPLCASCVGKDGGKEEALFGEFLAYDMELNEVTEEVLADTELTMFNIWATSCGPCISEMPSLGELNEEYADEGFQIIGIVTDILTYEGEYDAGQALMAYEIISLTGADYLHLIPSEDLVEKRLKDLSVVPETFFVDQEGNIVGETYYGAKTKEEWAEIIEELLAEVTE